MQQAHRPRILVVGCGGIGGIVSAHLLQHASELVDEVVPLTTNDAIAAAVEAHGLRVVGHGGPFQVAARARTALTDADDPFDYVLLATQPPQVEEAAREALPWLAEDGRIVVFQNGLCEERIARFAGADRVLGAVVAWGASKQEPGVFERTSEGGFTLGRLDGVTEDPRLQELALLLEAIGPVTVTGNLRGARWSKLAINCAISTLGTLGGDRLGVVMRHRSVRRLALEVMTEVVEVARREEVRLEKVSGTLDLDWIALTEAERRSKGSPGLVTKHAMLLAVGTRYRNLRSSMLSAIERGRTPAVDFLNGEIVARGEAHGIPTPVNALARQMVHELAAGERASGMKTLEELADRTYRA